MIGIFVIFFLLCRLFLGEGFSFKFWVCNVFDFIVCVLKECNNFVLEIIDYEKDKRKI